MDLILGHKIDVVIDLSLIHICKVSLSKEETVQEEVSESEANEVPEKEDSVQEEKN